MSKKPPQKPPPASPDRSGPQGSDGYSDDEALGTLFEQLCGNNPTGDPTLAGKVTVVLEELDPKVDPSGQALKKTAQDVNDGANRAAHEVAPKVVEGDCAVTPAAIDPGMKEVDAAALREAVEEQVAPRLTKMNKAAARVREAVRELQKAGKATKAKEAAGFTVQAAQDRFYRTALKYHHFTWKCFLATIGGCGLYVEPKGIFVTIAGWAITKLFFDETKSGAKK